MAKKSSKSKGYRKSQQKKPFLTKKEIIALIIIVAVVVAAFIVINNLPDGFIGESAVQQGDILSYGTTKVRDRYLKLGTINDLEGFTRTDTKAETTAMVNYTYKPDDETSPITYVSVSGSPIEAKTLAQSTVQQMLGHGYTMGEIHETEVQGYKAYVFSSTISYYEEPEPTEEAVEEAVEEETAEEPAAEEPAEEEPADNTFTQNVTMYVDCENEHTLAMHVSLKGSDESVYVPENALVDFMEPFTKAFTLIPKNAEAK